MSSEWSVPSTSHVCTFLAFLWFLCQFWCYTNLSAMDHLLELYSLWLWRYSFSYIWIWSSYFKMSPGINKCYLWKMIVNIVIIIMFKIIGLLSFQKTQYHTKRIGYDWRKLLIGYYCFDYNFLCVAYFCIYIPTMET